jgi:cobyrinic acid a,c-diamide synthase
MGGRYGQLQPHIIAFRARVRATRATFKLGQDETDTTFHEIVAGLAGTPLAELMSAQRNMPPG